VTLLRQVEVELANGNHTASLQRSRDHRTDLLPLAEGFGGLRLDQAKRLKELERENAKLKRLVPSCLWRSKF